MNLSSVSQLARRLCPPPRRLTRPCVMPMELPAEPEEPGCGWFDSSYELRHGIELVEVEWTDAELPPGMEDAIQFM